MLLLAKLIVIHALVFSFYVPRASVRPASPPARAIDVFELTEKLAPHHLNSK